MSEKKKTESITEKKITRRSMLKWTGALAAAVAVGVGAGYQTNELLRPITTVTETETQTVIKAEEKRYTQCTTGGATFVYVSNGRIVRTEPMWWPKEEITNPWTIKVGEKTFSAQLKFSRASWAAAERRWVYSPARGQYPLKRVDWNPAGERHPENRGKSDYVRISWNEAYDIIAGEIKRVKEKYGNSAIVGLTSAHNEWGSFHYSSLARRFYNTIGGYTSIIKPFASSEAWSYGAAFIWGCWWKNGNPELRDVLCDALPNSKQIILWGTDPILVAQIYEGRTGNMKWLWFKELGKKIIAINPHLGQTALYHADKWIPIIPGTDAALAAAVAYVWITEGTYDKQYLDTHAIGFDEEHLPTGAPPNSSFKSYVLGLVDGVPKTPEWAEPITGVKVREIRALAREWASKPTMLLCVYSGACRAAYAHEWTRMMATLQAMQGLGKPGVSVTKCYEGWIPFDERQKGIPGYALGGTDFVAKKKSKNLVSQVIQANLLEQSLFSPPVKWRGGGNTNTPPPYGAIVWKQFEYPMPGNSEIHMIMQYGSKNFHVEQETHRFMKMYQSQKIEFVVNQAPWFESDSLYSDIYLPVNTQFERFDVSEAGSTGWTSNTFNSCMRVNIAQQKCIDSLYESKNDYQIYTDICDRLGLKDVYTEGNTEEDWCRKLYALSNIPLSYEEFWKKGYYVFQELPGFTPTNDFRWFYEKPVGEGLATPSGKLEIFSQDIFNHLGAFHPEACAVPRYIPSWEGRHSHPLVDKYPLQLLTTHPPLRYHGKYDQVTWLRDLYKVKGPDGYQYEPIVMNPKDAAKRGLKDGDIVRVFTGSQNRSMAGQILCAVVTSPRLMPGVVWVAYGPWPDLVERGKPGSLDKSGNSNVLTPSRGTSELNLGSAYNSCLVEVERWVA